MAGVDGEEWNEQANGMLTFSQTSEYSNYEVTELSKWYFKNLIFIFIEQIFLIITLLKKKKNIHIRNEDWEIIASLQKWFMWLISAT